MAYIVWPINVLQHCIRVSKITTEHEEQPVGTLIHWFARCLACKQVGTGFHGTLAGNAYCMSKRILDEIRAFKGMEAAEEDEDEPAGDVSATHQVIIYMVTRNKVTLLPNSTHDTRPLELVSEPIFSKTMGPHTTKTVALGTSRRDLSIDATLCACTLLLVEKNGFKFRSRECAILRVTRFGKRAAAVMVGLTPSLPS